MNGLTYSKSEGIDKYEIRQTDKSQINKGTERQNKENFCTIKQTKK